jgi:hypothetical protein
MNHQQLDLKLSADIVSKVIDGMQEKISLACQSFLLFYPSSGTVNSQNLGDFHF